MRSRGPGPGRVETEAKDGNAGAAAESLVRGGPAAGGQGHSKGRQGSSNVWTKTHLLLKRDKRVSCGDQGKRSGAACSASRNGPKTEFPHSGSRCPAEGNRR